MVELGVAIVAALGTVISAYVAGKIRTVAARTNGELDDLRARVALLEEVLRWSQADVPDSEDSTCDGECQVLDKPY